MTATIIAASVLGVIGWLGARGIKQVLAAEELSLSEDPIWDGHNSHSDRSA
jgi:hypothetical protein